MKDNWFKVEKATIFFRSVSKTDCNPLITKVVNLIQKKINRIIFVFIKSNHWINKKIPAVTRVDEWTNAEIGVGAAIAKGNQDENGNWALLVIITNKNIKDKINDIPFSKLNLERE